MIKTESIDIDRPAPRVFSVLTDLAQVTRISPSLTLLEVSLPAQMAAGMRFRQLNRIHGRSYRQTVLVTRLEPDVHLLLRRNSMGMTIDFDYALSVLADGGTRVQLTKTVHRGLLSLLLAPLLGHFLSQPEHDGAVLPSLKAAVLAAG